MKFTNNSIEELNKANNLVEEFKSYALKRARTWIEQHQDNPSFAFPDVEVIFSPSSSIWIENLETFLNSTGDASLQICYQTHVSPFTRNIYIPADFILNSD